MATSMTRAWSIAWRNVVSSEAPYLRKVLVHQIPERLDCGVYSEAPPPDRFRCALVRQAALAANLPRRFRDAAVRTPVSPCPAFNHYIIPHQDADRHAFG